MYTFTKNYVSLQSYMSEIYTVLNIEKNPKVPYIKHKLLKF